VAWAAARAVAGEGEARALAEAEWAAERAVAEWEEDKERGRRRVSRVAWERVKLSKSRDSKRKPKCK
jgi:hypothetical protein